MDREETPTNDDASIPLMDNENKNMLNSMYQNMDPSSMSLTDGGDYDPSNCETR
ncbi:hypothetical protein I4U23_028865 [Adineta vaga]|nr:hypothetical protein I4U23_028865 [Adineta vaga]